MRSRCAVAVVLGLIAFASRARAQELELPVFGPTTFSMTNTATARYRGQNFDANSRDDDFASVADRLDAFLQGDKLRLELRLDAFLPFAIGSDPWIGPQASNAARCQDSERELCYLAADIRPERFVLRYADGPWQLELGDSQLVLGRGIALSFRKVDLLGVDTALRGGHARWVSDDVEVRVHGGVTNPQNQDPKTLAIIAEPTDVIVGGSVGAHLFDRVVHLSGHALRAWFEDDLDSGVRGRAIDVAGWSLEFPALFGGEVSVYAEANGLRRTEAVEGRDMGSFGRAVYASLQFQKGDVTVLAEWKDYRDFLVAPSALESAPSRTYSASPTLEPDGPQRVRAPGNQRGGSLRFDYAALPGPWSFSLNGSFQAANELTEEDPEQGVLISHGWTTLTRRQEDESIPWSLELAAGYREERFNHDPFGPQVSAGDLDRRLFHARADVAVSSGEHTFDLVVDHAYFEERRLGGLVPFQQGGVSLTYTFGIPFAVTLAVRWYNEKLDETSRRNVRYGAGEIFPSLDLKWSFDAANFVRLFIGATPGGRLCVGGACRDVPPFEGVSLQWVARI